MKVGIIGCGVVGGAVRAGLLRLGHKTYSHDIKYGTTIKAVLDTDVCFICVPTPEKVDGACDTSIVEDVIYQLDSNDYVGIIAIKSTVTPGTTERLAEKFPERELCFVPEFLREKSAFYDFTEGHDVCVIGTNSDEVYKTIKRVHGHYPKDFFKLSPTEAELCKYFSNVYNALRVTFANGFYDVCKKLGANYTAIKNAMVNRPTLLDMYLDCNENFRGFAGVCLPKDTSAFASLASDLGVKANIFSTIVSDNRLYKPTVFDGMRLK